jgi:hypothetical protein
MLMRAMKEVFPFSIDRSGQVRSPKKTGRRQEV